MSALRSLDRLAGVTAFQWGLTTAAQATAQGVSHLDLARLADAGALERVVHGVYRDAGSPADEFTQLRAAWLAADPARAASERLADGPNGVVVAGESAAALHRIGDFWAREHDFVSARRRQTQRVGVRFRRRVLSPDDIAVIEGLPTMTVERTIVDLVEQVGDLSLVSDALRDAATRRKLDTPRLAELLASSARRYGLAAGDGGALLDRLQQIAGIDPLSVARRIVADPTLATHIESLIRGKNRGGR